MFKRRMNKVLLVTLVLICLPFFSHAESISDIRSRQLEDALYYLVYMQNQMGAVDNDMAFHFGWAMEDKDGMKAGAKSAIDELDLLRTSLITKGMPPELTEVKNELMAVLEKQKNIYRGAESKTAEQIRSSYREFQKIFDEHIGRVDSKLDQYLRFQPLPENSSVVRQHDKLFKDAEDRAIFEQAVNLLSQRKFKESYDLFFGLKDKYRNTPAEGGILMGMSDCILSFDNDDIPEELRTQENGLSLLNEILDKKVYYPILKYAFHRWRTTEQSHNHGMSNWSDIPNLEYNHKRMDIIRVIQKHLIDHPDDNWAKAQILSLLSLENIRRGEQYGNSNLRHIAFLYMDMDEINKEADDEDPPAEAVKQGQ